MRVTQNLEQTQFLTAINQLESNLSTTQNQISSGKSFTTASQNPVAAGLVTGYNQALAQSQQYDTNSNSAQGSLNTEDSALTQVQSALQSLRDLALEANSGTESSQGLSAIATQASPDSKQPARARQHAGRQRQLHIRRLSRHRLNPLRSPRPGATYNGDQGQRQVQIAAGQTVVVGDNGDLVFNQIKTGNGTFVASAAAGNTGTGVVGATTVSDPTAYAGGTYSINFTAANAYQVVDTATNAVVTVRHLRRRSNDCLQRAASHAVRAAGGRRLIQRRAEQQPEPLYVGPEPGDGAAVHRPTGSTASAQLNNSINAAINNIDQALAQTQTVQSSVGARLNSITTQQSVAGDQQVQLQQSISTCRAWIMPVRSHRWIRKTRL